MKKSLLFFLALLFAVSFSFSCSKKKGPVPVPLNPQLLKNRSSGEGLSGKPIGKKNKRVKHGERPFEPCMVYNAKNGDYIPPKPNFGPAEKAVPRDRVPSEHDKFISCEVELIKEGNIIERKVFADTILITLRPYGKERTEERIIDRRTNKFIEP